MKKGHLNVTMACCTVDGASADPPQDIRRRLDRSAVLAMGLLTMSVTIVDAILVTVTLSASVCTTCTFKGRDLLVDQSQMAEHQGLNSWSSSLQVFTDDHAACMIFCMIFF